MPSITLAINHLKAHDPLLAYVIEFSTPPTLQAHTNYYQALVDSIISQQLSVKAASAIEKRFIHLFDHQFPTPKQILSKDTDTLRAVGLSRPKIRYIQDLAQHILDGTVRFDTIDALTNSEIITELTKVKGIGEWTVHMFLIFCMGRLDVLPVGDLGIKNGIQKLYHIDHLPSADDIQEIARIYKWHPYESVASWYVWQSLNNTPEIAI